MRWIKTKKFFDKIWFDDLKRMTEMRQKLAHFASDNEFLFSHVCFYVTEIDKWYVHCVVPTKSSETFLILVAEGNCRCLKCW